MTRPAVICLTPDGRQIAEITAHTAATRLQHNNQPCQHGSFVRRSEEQRMLTPLGAELPGTTPREFSRLSLREMTSAAWIDVGQLLRDWPLVWLVLAAFIG